MTYPMPWGVTVILSRKPLTLMDWPHEAFVLIKPIANYLYATRVVHR